MTILTRAKAIQLSSRLNYELGVTGRTRNHDEHGNYEELAAARYGDAEVLVWVCVDSEGCVICVA